MHLFVSIRPIAVLVEGWRRKEVRRARVAECGWRALLTNWSRSGSARSLEMTDIHDQKSVIRLWKDSGGGRGSHLISNSNNFEYTSNAIPLTRNDTTAMISIVATSSSVCSNTEGQVQIPTLLCTWSNHRHIPDCSSVIHDRYLFKDYSIGTVSTHTRRE